MGQEVVVQFEDGNPDRPIIIGMLYNEAKKHPFDFPANMTQSGIKTNSSKGGGGFHELVFEDKKDEEFVRLQSEKDYKETIKNNAEISIGFEKKDPGDLTEKIYHHKTTELETGDHTFSVKAGKEVRTIAKTREMTVGEDETISIGANETITVGADREETVGANETITIGADREETVGGNETITIGGDMTLTVGGKFELDVGSDILIKSGSKITLEVGGTTVVIDSSSVTIDSSQITATASGSFEASGSGSATVSSDGSLSLSGTDATFEGSASGTVKSSGILTVQGSLVKIN
jgi:type VI secretion system secreted protein VgrG